MKITKLSGVTPRIILSLQAYMKMRKIIDKVDKECAWHGCVTRDGNVYRINDIEIYPQTVTGATVEADEEKYPLWILQHTDEQINTMRFQGHSHVNMGVSPSGVDLDFYDKLTEQVKDFYIFIIQNKKGEYNLRLIDKESGLLYEDLTYEIDYGIPGLEDWYTESIKQIETKTWRKSSPLVTVTSGKDSTSTTVTTTGDTEDSVSIPELEEEEMSLMYAIEESVFDVINYSTSEKIKKLYEKACKQHDKFLGIIEGWYNYKMDGDKDRAIIAYNKLVDISIEIEQQLEKEGF